MNTVETNTARDGRVEVAMPPTQRSVERARAAAKVRQARLADRDLSMRVRVTVGSLAGPGWTKPHPIERKAKAKKARKAAAKSRAQGR